MNFFLPECGAEIVFQISLCIVWFHNDSMYVRFDELRNTKTWSKFRSEGYRGLGSRESGPVLSHCQYF